MKNVKRLIVGSSFYAEMRQSTIIYWLDVSHGIWWSIFVALYERLRSRSNRVVHLSIYITRLLAVVLTFQHVLIARYCRMVDICWRITRIYLFCLVFWAINHWAKPSNRINYSRSNKFLQNYVWYHSPYSKFIHIRMQSRISIPI